MKYCNTLIARIVINMVMIIAGISFLGFGWFLAYNTSTDIPWSERITLPHIWVMFGIFMAISIGWLGFIVSLTKETIQAYRAYREHQRRIQHAKAIGKFDD